MASLSILARSQSLSSIGASRPSEASIVVASAYAYYASQGEEKKMKMMFCAEEEKEPVVKKILDLSLIHISEPTRPY